MRKLLIAILILLLVLSACTGGDTAEIAPPGNDAAPTEAFDEDMGGEAEAPSDAPVAFQRDVIENRKIIQEAFLELTDDDTETLFKRITNLVEQSGGFVASAELTRSGDEGRGPFIDIVVRVPADEMSATLTSIEDLADEVTSKRIGSQDVTEEYADIEAQLRNLNALEEELLIILTEVREKADSDANELLNVFQRIREVRDEIERLEGRQRLFDDLIDLATVTISLFPEAVGAPIVDEGWQPGEVVKDALRATVDALQSIVDGLIWFALGVLPVLLIVGIPLLVVIWFVRRLARRRSAPQPEEAETGSPDEKA